jgi:hypothetical protein
VTAVEVKKIACDSGEDGCVGPNAPRQRNDGHGRKAGALDQLVNAVTQILPESLHEFYAQI